MFFFLSIWNVEVLLNTFVSYFWFKLVTVADQTSWLRTVGVGVVVFYRPRARRDSFYLELLGRSFCCSANAESKINKQTHQPVNPNNWAMFEKRKVVNFKSKPRKDRKMSKCLHYKLAYLLVVVHSNITLNIFILWSIPFF